MPIVRSIEQQAERDPAFRDALVAAILDTTPCAVCGLERFAHAATTERAGNAPHAFKS